MTQPKHTPAPWTQDDTHIRQAGQNANHLIAVVRGTESVAADEANARLIAAAPELLEALKIMVSELRDSENGTICFDGFPKAIAAIAKAEGGDV